MTQYLWNDPDHGGDWNNTSNWKTLTQPAPGGPPGAGDDVIINLDVAAVITTDGATVASLTDEDHTVLMGDLTVTGDLALAVLSGGEVSAGEFNFGQFNGTTLSAGSISGSTLNTGEVQVDDFIRGSVNGGTVSALAIDPLADNDAVFVSGGTLSAQELLLDAQFAALVVSGGAVTIGSAAVVDGPVGEAAEIIVSGGQLTLLGGLKLDGGARLNDGSLATTSAGGLVTTKDLTVGDTGSGAVFIGGSNALVTVTSDFVLGESGSGSLTIANGGHMTVGGNAESAVKSGSTATGTVDDATANFVVDGDWDIGVAGTAAWTISDAVTVSVGGVTELGVSSGGSGTLTISDAGTTLVTGGGGVIIGGEGAGTLILQSGATFDASAALLKLGEAAKSKGTLELNDAGTTLTADNAIIGGAGSGALILVGGSGTLSGTVTLGESKGGVGGLSVTDGGMTFAGDMAVGDAGKGMLTLGPDGIIAPGALQVPAGSTNTITLGKQAGAKGTVNVSGAGALLESFGLVVGGAGGGSLSIGNQGKVVTTGSAEVGEAVTATIQKVSVTSGGNWTVGGHLELGVAAIATATISGGGQISVSGNLTMGVQADATGIIVLTGGQTVGSHTTPSRLKWGTTLLVGVAGTGNLTIANGAQALSNSGSQGLLEIGLLHGAKGTVSVSGAGSELIGQTLAVGGSLQTAGGAGSLTVGSGAVARFAQGGAIWAGGQVSVGGLLTMGSTIDDRLLTATAGGTIRVTGGFTGTGKVAIGAGGLFTLNASKTDTANRVRIDNNAGAFSVAGGSAGDQFQLSVAALRFNDVVDGGAGNDVLQFTTAGTIVAAAFAHVTGIDVIKLGVGATVMTITNPLVTSSDGDHLTIVGSVAGVETINASAVASGTLVFNGVATAQTVFTAGSGTVALTGGGGADTFKFKAANLKSQDGIIGGLGHDVLDFTTAGAINATAFTLVTGIDEIDLANGTNTLTIGNALAQHSDAHSLAIDGGAGNDTINAAAVASGATLVFSGGGGVDVIRGGMGDNIYKVAKGAEALSITNSFTGGTAAHGALQFGAGLTDQSLWFEKSGANLVIDVIGSKEQVTLAGWFGANKSAQVGEIQAGGLELDAGVSKLVTAMAAYAAAHPGFDPTASGVTMPTDSTLQTAITTNWHH